MSADAFVVAEEKKLVGQDRSAKRPAKNILRIRVLLIAVVVVQPRVGIELLIGQKVVEGAVEVVSTRLQDGDHLPAACVSKCSIRVA